MGVVGWIGGGKGRWLSFWLWRLGWCVVGCWVLVVAAGMVGCRLLGFGCGSCDGGLCWLGWWVVGCWVLVVAVGMVSCGCL